MPVTICFAVPCAAIARQGDGASASLRGKCFSPHFVPCFAVASLRDSPQGLRSVCRASRNPQTENGPVCAEASAGRRAFDLSAEAR